MLLPLPQHLAPFRQFSLHSNVNSKTPFLTTQFEVPPRPFLTQCPMKIIVNTEAFLESGTMLNALHYLISVHLCS